MTYLVGFRDKTTTVIDNADGEALSKLLTMKTKQEYLQINGATYRTSEVVSVKPGGGVDNVYTHAEVTNARQIGDHKTCIGKYSIQKEINNIIRNDYPGKWTKLIQDKNFREQLRLQLRETPDVNWCDNKINECYCWR